MSHADEGVLRQLFSSSGAACIAEASTLPLDTAKVRLQLQIAASSAGNPRKYRGPLQTIATMVKEEGMSAPFKGLAPGLQRAALFTALRLGLYERIRDGFAGADGSMPLYGKVATALCTSAVGITAANSADVVKVRFQAAVGPPPYSGSLAAYAHIMREEGLVHGLYKGFHANLMRNSIISATELVTYDTAKELLLEAGLEDGVRVHLSAGVCAGFLATVLGSPADVIGTRLMAAKASHSQADNIRLFAFVMGVLKTEGVGAFYKGFLPNFARIGSFNIMLWASYEQLKRLW